MNNPAIKELVYLSRRKLVDHKILKPSVLDKHIRASDAHSPYNHDWRYLCLAQLI